MLTREAVMEALKAVKYFGYSRDIVSFGLVKEVAVEAGTVRLALQLTGGTPEVGI
jgi:ATP-binding protein involved in chromosome partitioning